MNIVLLLNNDVASNLALNLLLPELQAHNVTVFLSSKVGGNAKQPLPLQQLAQFEQQEIFQRLQHNKYFKNYQDITRQYGITIETLNHINSDQGYRIISACQPDIIISIRFGVILKDPVIQLPKWGVINLHSGALPDYRGVMATFWAINNGEKQLASTLHYIDDSSIDTGRIISTSLFDVQQGKSYLWHVLNLYVGGCQLIKQAIKDIENKGKLPIVESQQENEGNYYSFPDAEQLTAFVDKYGDLYKQKEDVTLISTLL